MLLKNRLYIYAENWPAGDHIPATGLDRALVPIAAALAPLQPLLLLKTFVRRCLRYSLHPDLVRIARRPGLLALAADELRQRTGADYNNYSFSGQSLIRNIVPAGGVLFSVVGGDGRAYLRADRIARQAGLAHVVYSVDDPIAWAEERRHQLPRLAAASQAVEEVLRNASAVLAISDGLASSLGAKLGRAVDTLPLPYLLDPPVDVPRKQQVIFLGNVSHLYADAFVSVIDAVGALRAKGIDISFRATCTPENIAGIVSSIPDYLVLGRIHDRAELAREINSSAAAICPISFHPEQEMVRTSFPSKLLDYLSHARAIIVHGPADSVASRYFVENDIKYTTNSQDALQRTLSQIVAEGVNYNKMYRQCLAANHGLPMFRETVMAAMPQDLFFSGDVT